MDKRACLLLHGFTGGPFEVAPLGQCLEHRGWECKIPTLPGHDKGGGIRSNVSWTDWVAAAESEAEKLAREKGAFDLVGFSMGGMIAAYIANRYPVRRLVLLNAAFIYVSPRRFAGEFIRRWKMRDWSHVHKINQTPLSATLQFMLLVRKLRPEIRSIRVPTLIIQGLKDHVVHPYSAKILVRRIGGNVRMKCFPLSRHMICLEEEAGDVFQAVADFLMS